MVTPIEDVIKEKKIIILSPHYDDVLLTFGGYLDALYRDNLIDTKDIRVVNIFSRSTYQAHDDVGNKDVSLERIKYATGIRLLEDLECLDELIGHENYTYELLGERECLLRDKNLETNEAFEFPHGTRDEFGEEDWQIYERLKKYVLKLFALKNSAILLPLGVKEHIDHIILREAVVDAKREIKDNLNAVIYFGEDQPYSGHANQDEWEKAEAFLKENNVLSINYPVNILHKTDLLFKHYTSQVEESYGEGVHKRAYQLKEMFNCDLEIERIYKVIAV